MTAFERLRLARSKGRPTALSYIENIFYGFFELHGDRLYGDDPAITGGLAWLGNRPVTVIGIEKGSVTKDRIVRNFGSAHPEGYRKALRLMREAEKFSRPVICFIDTSGAFCGVGAEERGQGSAIAENLRAMMSLKTPVISVFIGEGGSGGALALAVGDEVWMLENSVYSVISPEGAASIIWKDPTKVEAATLSLKITAEDLLELNVIERIFEEPLPGNTDFTAVYAALGAALEETLAKKELLPLEELLEARYEKFRKVGRFLP